MQAEELAVAVELLRPVDAGLLVGAEAELVSINVVFYFNYR